MATSNEAYQAVGLSVVNCQYFEIAFTICVKLAFAQRTVCELSEIEPLDKNTFKVPAKALLNELKGHIEVSSEFETKLESVVERRHELVHRWVRRNKWPEDDDASGLEKITEFANKLSKDVNALTRILVLSINRWLAKFPKAGEVLKPLGDNWLMALPEEYRDIRIEKT
jgi:hypothetical protein